CKFMSRCTYISRILMSIIAMGMIVAFIGIPLIYTLHTHAGGADQYAAQRLEHGVSADGSNCGLCTFYAHYTPRDIDFRPSFTFAIPTVPVVVAFGQSECGAPRGALCDRLTNKGPPSNYRRI